MIYSVVFADFYVILGLAGFEGSWRFDHFLFTYAPNLFLEMSKWIWGSKATFKKVRTLFLGKIPSCNLNEIETTLLPISLKEFFPTTIVFNGNRAIFMHFHLRLLLWNSLTICQYHEERVQSSTLLAISLKLYFSAISRSISDTGRIEMTKCKRQISLVGQLTMWAVPKLFTLSSLIFGKLFWDPSFLSREEMDIEKHCHLLK